MTGLQVRIETKEAWRPISLWSSSFAALPCCWFFIRAGRAPLKDLLWKIV
jgi:hypothetical protein